MPSKRTNDSVDRILEDLNIQQAQAGLRDSVTDHQVDEILRSVGISTAPAQPVQGGFAFEADDDLGALLNDPGPAPSQAAPQCGQRKDLLRWARVFLFFKMVISFFAFY